MAHKARINGTAYTVQGGKCMVNGTVYNILKGRTLIDGTGWDITLPSVVTMPQKGDLITMNLDGTDRLYRVLKIVDGTTVEVLGMWWSYSPWGNTARIYAGSPVDAYLNNTWYNSLSNDAKEAIVPRNVVQDSWYWGTSGNPKYSGTYGTSLPGTSYSISLGDANFHSIGNRYVYALSIQDIIDYLSDSSVLVDASLMLKNQNLWKMLSNSTSSQRSVSFWLRSAIADQTDASWTMNPASGSFARNGLSSTCFRRPAFQIDLSKIDFTIGGGITFTINDTNYGGIGSYQADYGMTWGDWLSSPYNSVGYTANEFNEIISPVGHGSLFDESTNKYMKPTDTIEAGKSYTIVG